MIIGITGYKRHGKDTVSDYLVNNYDFKKLTFAEPLKDICKILFNFNDNQINGNDKEIVDNFWGITPRNAMQYIGTELFRNNINNLLPNINNNFWCKILENKILNNKETDIVISDLRFKNEEALIKKYNGIIIRVHNNNIINNDTHASEINIDNINYDYLLNNSFTLNDLYNKINNLIKIIKKMSKDLD